MHKAKKVTPDHGVAEAWRYRGGKIERHPQYPGSRGSWVWHFGGASGWVLNKAVAKASIDRLLAIAQMVLIEERNL